MGKNRKGKKNTKKEREREREEDIDVATCFCEKATRKVLINAGMIINIAEPVTWLDELLACVRVCNFRIE